MKEKTSLKQNGKAQGFTLIELLGAIVIVGILLAISISGVSIYITTVKKQVIVSTADSYRKTIVPEVNNQEYNFYQSDVIYALPIDCIQLEEGGENPLGEWLNVNENYWAYVLIQYNQKSNDYIYGFTFKDSNGNGMYPVVYEKMNVKGKDIKKNLSLTKPQIGDDIKLYDQITSEENWKKSGFKVSDTTQLKVLEAASAGDGSETCTLCQIGSNYEKIEREKYVPTVSLSLKRNGEKISIIGRYDNYKNSSKYYEVTSHGIIYIQTSRIGSRTLTLNTSGRTRVNFSEYSEDGAFTYNLNPSNKSTSYAFRAFLVYKDPETGKSVTKYSTMIRSSYNYIN